ncbi:MAG: chromosome partitioning protein ParB [Deltaproteobacteria bacterium]|nr:MAG: chromosome partitioning protein ParB [Deltaproteobacteria bacterium]
MAKRSGLGKGLDALLRGLEGEGEAEVFLCEVEELSPNPFQPRRDLGEEALEELARSIEQKGLLQPLLVRRKGEGYEIIAGERRWRAAQRAGLKRVPVILKEASDQEVLEMALVENLQRQDLNPLEEAEAYKRLMEEFGYTQEEVARRVGKDRSSVANTLRLLKLPPEVKEALREGRITAGHARALLAAGSPQEQLRLYQKVLREGLTVRDVEREARSRGTARRATEAYDPDTEALLEELRHLLKTQVRISYQRGKGKLEIEFYSLEDLERIVDVIRGTA